ncbi:AAA family ATPase [Desulfobaculum bizertense]|uniref:AAA family ATPase n=1 Tax=Desulfobaculum bizertense TaxID=376490 RepID=UPI001F3B0715|nr:ATP-binding protein [Desulfobaculum bizertense]UIJ36875.1 AAA family ATPase [Desulfobaculum bizertense]
MIEKFRIKNFKSFEDATLPLSHLTLLIGANASGKSNLIEALRFMNWLAQGKTLKEIDYQMRDDISPIRGDLKDLPHRGAQSFFFCIESKENFCLRISFRLTKNHGLTVSSESLSDIARKELFYNFCPKLGDQNPRVQVCTGATNVSPHRLPIFKDFLVSEKVPKRQPNIQHLLEGIRFLDTNLQKMRRPGRESDNILAQDGGNLAGVLYNLCKNNEHKATILGLIQQLPEQNIRDITFEKFRDDIHMSLCETFGGEVQEWDSASLSDGTLRVLAIGAALLSAPKGALVVVEEIDNGVHPSRAKHLITQLLEIAKERDLSLLLSTHNPALMNAIPDNAVKDAVFCYRDDKTGASKLKKLEDFDEFIELTARAPLGDLSTRNELKKSLISGSAEEKKAAALKWFDTFEKGL